MEPQDNRKLALQKAISAHEDAQAALADLMAGRSEAAYAAMLARIEQNLADLETDAASTGPEERV